MLMFIDIKLHNMVKGIAIDMANSIQKLSRRCFSKALQVTGRFHVSELAYDVVSGLRIAYCR